MILSAISKIVRDRQCAIRRELDRRGVSLKVVSFDSGIPYSTLLSYFPADHDKQPAMMPASTGAMPKPILKPPFSTKCPGRPGQSPSSGARDRARGRIPAHRSSTGAFCSAGHSARARAITSSSSPSTPAWS